MIALIITPRSLNLCQVRTAENGCGALLEHESGLILRDLPLDFGCGPRNFPPVQSVLRQIQFRVQAKLPRRVACHSPNLASFPASFLESQATLPKGKSTATYILLH